MPDETRTIPELLQDIAQADVARGVYRVSLVAAGHLSGFEAVVEMRGSDVDGFSGLSHKADSAEVALEGVEADLLAALGRCPECGGFRQGKTK